MKSTTTSYLHNNITIIITIVIMMMKSKIVNTILISNSKVFGIWYMWCIFHDGWMSKSLHFMLIHIFPIISATVKNLLYKTCLFSQLKHNFSMLIILWLHCEIVAFIEVACSYNYKCFLLYVLLIYSKLLNADSITLLVLIVCPLQRYVC